MGTKFDAMRAGYRNLWRAAEMKRESVVMRIARKIIEQKRDRYRKVEAATGVPWFWIACVHHRESGGDFRGVLHNGQKIIGTGRKTTIVPKGRGPFDTWEEAAIDALSTGNHKLNRISDWTVERMLYEFERYNGWGYNGKINSPYVWAATSQQQRGKYTSDGRYSSKTWDQQLGCAAILMGLMRLDHDVKVRVEGKSVPAPAPKPPQPHKPDPVPKPPTAPPKRSPGLWWFLGLLLVAAVTVFVIAPDTAKNLIFIIMEGLSQ